jgi:hypothetical protein
VFEHCLALVGRDGGDGATSEAADEVVLAGVAEVYQRSNILNVLRVDFDFQILDKANKSIIKGTTGDAISSACACVRASVWACVCGGACAWLTWSGRCAEMLGEFKEELEKRGVNLSIVVEAGDPRDKLCELADRVQPDLLVMGHHATALNLGSVALHCIEHSPSPVFIVRV